MSDLVLAPVAMGGVVSGCVGSCMMCGVRGAGAWVVGRVRDSWRELGGCLLYCLTCRLAGRRRRGRTGGGGIASAGSGMVAWARTLIAKAECAWSRD